MAEGLEQLRAELSAFRETLAGFDDPVVEEHAGLRLMAEKLRERTEHIAGEIAEQEVASLHVGFAGQCVAAELVAEVLGSLQRALVTVGEGLAGDAGPSVAAALLLCLDIHTPTAGVRLRRRPGTRDSLHVTADSGEPLVERALAALVDGIAAAGRGDPPHQALQQLGRALLGSGVVVTVSSTSPAGSDTVRVHQTLAARLADG